MIPAARCRSLLGRRPLRPLFVALVLALHLSATGPVTASLDRTLTDAATALARGEDMAALRLLEEAAALAPGAVGVLVPLARLQLRTGDLQAAETTAEQALTARPDHAPMLALLGDVLRASGRLAEAEHAYARALEADPAEPNARAGRARLALEAGDLDAVEALDIPADDRSLALRLAWADAEADRGELRAAIAKLDDLLQQNPGWMDALLRRGDYARQLGDLAAAHRDLARAVELDPLSAEARYRRGLLRRDLRNLPAALDDFNRAIALDGDFAAAYVARGSVYQAAGKQEVALADFDRALDADRAHGDALTHKATSECAQGAFRACLNASTVALASRPGDWRAQVAQGHALLGLDQPTAAVEAYVRALEEVDPEEAQWLLARLQRHLMPRLGDRTGFAWQFVAAQTPDEVARIAAEHRQRRDAGR